MPSDFSQKFSTASIETEGLRSRRQVTFSELGESALPSSKIEKKKNQGPRDEYQSQFELSRLLRFRDSMMQNEFVTYMRSEVFSQSCIILIFLFVLSLSIFALLSMSDADESTKLLLQIICIELSVPTVILFAVILLAVKRQGIIDYFGLSIQLPFTVAAYSYYLMP